MERREGRALGSPLRLVVAGQVPPARVDAAWAAVRREFDAVDRAMSRFREDSEITLLHRRRGRGDASAPVTRRLRAALALADRAGRVTGGRFDARVIVDLERLGSVAVRQSWPGARRDQSSRRHQLDARGGTVALLSPVDLGGLGKGLALRWATDRAAAILGGRGFLLEAGGDIASRATAGGEPWVIAIEDPLGGPEPIATCTLPLDGAIATSSVRLATWRDPAGRAVHHLIDPSTGEPGGVGLRAVTVGAPDSAWAEIWSKALFLEGSRRIAEVARAQGLAAWWIDERGELSLTPAARQRTTWIRAETAREPRAAALPRLSPLEG